jgi:hypothetical protein
LITVIATAVVALGLAMATPSFASASDGGDDCTMAQASYDVIWNSSLCGPRTQAVAETDAR